MSTRREFLKQTTAATLLAGASASLTVAGESRAPPARIKEVIRRDETIIRYGGNGDVYPLTWASDNRQYSAFLDGAGWSDTPLGEYNTRVFSVTGDPDHARFENLVGYPDLSPIGTDPRYYGFGLLALDGHVYQFLNTLGAAKTGWHWTGTKLIFSPDNGRTWRNQDGSTPVVWESYARQSRKNLLFLREQNQAFSLVSILQMGQNYRDNRDGYVYLYSPNGFVDGLMNQLVLARVPKARILERGQYQFFAGLQLDGAARWSASIDERTVVHEFPRGWVNTTNGPETMIAQSWVPSVTYNAPLGLYMMANWGDGPAHDGSWFGKPSYLGFWTAPNPWGPWSQVHEETAWLPGNDHAARCYSPQIAPKWIAEDGKSFWLVWTDFKGVVELGEQLKKEGDTGDTREDTARFIHMMRKAAPYYSFNVQRVDLVVS